MEAYQCARPAKTFNKVLRMKINTDEISFECVRPLESHARQVMEWRNDPETLRQSFHSKPKVWESFKQEFFDQYFLFPELPPLFAVYNGVWIAFLRFRPIPHPTGLNRRCCDISINVAPEFRGKGFGQAILTLVQPWLAQQGYDDLYAEIKKENIHSQKAFEQARFIKLHDDIKEVEDTGEKVLIGRYFVELKPQLTLEKPVFIIAEGGSNWVDQTAPKDLKMAFELIAAAAEAGADAIKFQIFRPETTYVKNAGPSDYLSDAGICEEMQELYAPLAMPYEFIPKLAEACKNNGIEFMASAFSPDDFKAVDPYVKRHKIASYEIGHLHLLELAGQSGKPLLLSTGAATEHEIAWAVQTFHAHGGVELTLLQCTACYPAEASTLHLRTIPWLKQRFKVEAGLSDHSLHPILAPVAAVALGAKVIEKHFTLNRNLPGPDHAYAVTPDDLKELVTAIRQTETMLGSFVKIVDPSEEELRAFARRGIQALKDITKGEILREGKNIGILRPGKQPLGIHPGHIYEIEGKKSVCAISAGHGIQKGDWI